MALAQKVYCDGGHGLEEPVARPTRQNFAENLSRIMLERDMSAAELSRALFVSQASVGKWKTGQIQPSFETMDKLAKVLGCTVEELFRDPLNRPESTQPNVDDALRILKAYVDHTKR